MGQFRFSLWVMKLYTEEIILLNPFMQITVKLQIRVILETPATTAILQ
jgi:hypothetical protein